MPVAMLATNCAADGVVVEQRLGDGLGTARVEHGAGHHEAGPGQGSDPEADAEEGGSE